jgi:hypothetical protein
MVPHHHHSVETNPLYGHTSPAGQHDHNQSPGKKQPAHCHAFDEISFYKQALPGLSKPSEMPVLYVYIASPIRSVFDVTIVSGVITPLSPIFLSWYGEHANALRGPPSTC